MTDSRSESACPSDKYYTNVYIGAGAKAQLGDTYTSGNHGTNQCLTDLQSTDPRYDRERIQDTKDELLRDSYEWILQDKAFTDWRDDNEIQLLWIKGDPGKGKTMMMIGLTHELSKYLESKPGLLSYFFCQATETKLNNAVAVLKGLIYLLVDQQKNLIRHLQKRYDKSGKQLFEDVNAFYALSSILSEMLHDPSLERVYLMVDALDECDSGLRELLKLITTKKSCSAFKVKWLVTSRNRPDIEEELQPDGFRLKICLELNQSHISNAVDAFISSRVSDLAKLKNYDNELQKKVSNVLHEKADGTFLWIALVCKELERIRRGKTESALTAFPRGLESLYERMMILVYELEGKDEEDIEFCRKILSAVTLAYRPLHQNELAVIAGLPKTYSKDPQSLQELIDLCGSFVTVRDGIIYLVHQSARDYFSTGKGSKIFLLNQAQEHYEIACRSLRFMSETLTEDICRLQKPGTLLHDINGDTLVALSTQVGYACCYWVDHLRRIYDYEDQSVPSDNGKIYDFLLAHFLHWLEALSLMKMMPKGVLMVQELLSTIKSSEAPELYSFIIDANRFILNSKSVIENAPLQTYSSALVFSPSSSKVKTQFRALIPGWLRGLPNVEEDWGALLQTLEGHSSSVTAVAFSPDGRLVASASYDETVRLWDTTTGGEHATLKGHSSSVTAVAFSPDGRLVASASYDETVRLWDTTTGGEHATLKGHSRGVTAVAFSPDGRLVASASYDETVRLWDTTTGGEHATLKGHSRGVTAVAFSPDGRLVASASYDETVRLWDTTTREATHIFKTEQPEFNISFSYDGSYDGSYLQTNCGPLYISQSLTGQPQVAALSYLSVKEQWLASGTENILWLPPNYRPTNRSCVAVRGNIVVIGHAAGQVSFFRFDLSKLSADARPV